ncbi:MAG: HAD family hydrolase [bacterium]|nr:HAD family hydrolase [bacterium]
MSTIRLVLFDGYGTLFEDAMDPLLETCGRIARESNLDLSAQEFLHAWDKHFFSLLQGNEFITLREAHFLSLERLFQELETKPVFRASIDDLFRTFSQSPAYEDVNPTLAGLASLDTGVVSNADADHLTQALELNRLNFSVVVSSESARCYKPSPGIFYEALEKFGHSPEETLYVGDSQEDDIVGARNAGLRIAWLNRKNKPRKPDIPKPDYEISSLRELLGIV